MQILIFLALLIIPLGLLIFLACAYRGKNKIKSDISKENLHESFGFVELLKTSRNGFFLGFSVLAIFPILLLLFQLIHGPNANPYLFTVGYLLFSFLIGGVITISYLQILNRGFHIFVTKSSDISLAIAGLLSTSIYIAWIAAAFMELAGNAWRGNVQWQHIIDGLFGIVVGTLCIVLVRISVVNFGSRSSYIILSLLIVSLFSWIILSAKAGMPLYLRIPKIMQFPRYYSVRGEDIIMRSVYLFQAILTQILIPIALMLSIIDLIRRKGIAT